MTLTEEQIVQFEQDIKDGKEVDIKNYKLSSGISDLIKNSVIKIFSSISGFVSE